VQCKTTADLAKSNKSPLARTIGQLVNLGFKVGPETLAQGKAVAVLAVTAKASGSLEVLESACRQFDQGGVWSVVSAQGSEAQRNALAIFAEHVRTAWTGYSQTPPTDEQLVALARSFRIRRFSETAEGADWREAAGLLGQRLYGDQAAGSAPMADLFALMRRVIRTGAPVDRLGLLRGLRAAGHEDVSTPSYAKDIAAVQDYSDGERRRLAKHTRLPISGGVPIPRDCLQALAAAVGDGSLLVIGEPGAGKTGILLSVADHMSSGPGPVVFLSVERFSGFRRQADFRDEMRLEHDLLDVLANWPGLSPGVLLIDALDASRGGSAEAVITTFISEAVERLGGRWSVVASIRTFDLKNGRRFREIFPGAAPDPLYAEDDLRSVRHFKVLALRRRCTNLSPTLPAN
jgi:hypothetical protein